MWKYDRLLGIGLKHLVRLEMENVILNIGALILLIGIIK